MKLHKFHFRSTRQGRRHRRDDALRDSRFFPNIPTIQHSIPFPVFKAHDNSKALAEMTKRRFAHKL
jgi:hypothetical protein